MRSEGADLNPAGDGEDYCCERESSACQGGMGADWEQTEE